MLKSLVLAILVMSCAFPASAKKKAEPPDPAWAGITARGRMLAEYESAILNASDAVMALNPERGSTTSYVAQKTDGGWVVVFGRLNEAKDAYLVLYRAMQGATPNEFKSVLNTPAQKDTGYFYTAAKAMETSRQDFERPHRPYHFSVLPAESGQMYVYIFPAQTRPGIYPLGGDARYLISADGSTIVEKRLLHRTILENDQSKIPPGAKLSGGFHTHVLTDLPEDTDVSYVLIRKPSMPEMIGAGKRVYKVEVDGTIERTD